VCREQSVAKLDAFTGRMTVLPRATDDREVIRKAVAGCNGVLARAEPRGRRWASAQAQTGGSRGWLRRGSEELSPALSSAVPAMPARLSDALPRASTCAAAHGSTARAPTTRRRTSPGPANTSSQQLRAIPAQHSSRKATAQQG